MKVKEALTKTNLRNNEYENSVTKLFLHEKKCKSIVNVTRKNKEYDDTLPICIEIHLTDKCNLDCEWCIDKHVRNNNKEIPYTSLLNLLNCLEGSEIGIVIEGGGEPTLHKNFDQFVLECYKRNISVGLISNGTKRLSKEIINCFSFIRISIDSTNPEEYKVEKGKDYFNTVLDNVRFIREHNEDVILGLGFVLTNRNYKNISDLFDMIADLNINFIRLRNIEEYDELSLTKSMMKEVQDVINVYKGKTSTEMVLSAETETNQENNNSLPCVAHSLRSVIHANGEVILCTKRRHDPLVIGNINKNEFLKIWNSEKRIESAIKLLDKDNQNGCTICRMTKYNEIFYNLIRAKTRNFI